MNEVASRALPEFTAIDSLGEALARLDLRLSPVPGAGFGIARLYRVDVAAWGLVARECRRLGFRWAGLWLDHLEHQAFCAYAAFEKQGCYVVVTTDLSPSAPSLPSHALYYPAADRVERHASDLFGIPFVGHPDPRPWVRHQAWSDYQFPLRKEFPAAGSPSALTPPDSGYPFLASASPEVYEIPVGPVHAGIIEPGHFRFLAMGEAVLNLEERLGYVHKGIEKIAEGRDASGLARLAGRVSGDSTVAHSWAACMAMEQACGLAVPPRAVYLRAILLERERIANHLGDIGAICNDVGFPFANYQFTRLKEGWLRENLGCFGHRLLMDRVVPGGVVVELPPENVEAMRHSLTALDADLRELRPLLETNHSLQDRLVNAGVLSLEAAESLGCLGYVGRASGFDSDLRRSWRNAPYDSVTLDSATRQDGDVAARLDVRYDEIHASIELLRQLLDGMPSGDILAGWPNRVQVGEGLGLVEGWRGEVLAFVRFDQNGRVARYHPRDPSVFNWPALERLIHGNIVPDFPLCNKSVNGSYAGHDL